MKNPIPQLEKRLFDWLLKRNTKRGHSVMSNVAFCDVTVGERVGGGVAVWPSTQPAPKCVVTRTHRDDVDFRK